MWMRRPSVPGSDKDSLKCASLCSSVRGVSRADLIAFLTLDGPPRQQLLSLPMSDSPDVSSYSGEVGV